MRSSVKELISNSLAFIRRAGTSDVPVTSPSCWSTQHISPVKPNCFAGSCFSKHAVHGNVGQGVTLPITANSECIRVRFERPENYIEGSSSCIRRGQKDMLKPAFGKVNLVPQS